MSTLALAIEAFFFLRPLWLLALPVIAVLWWTLRARAGAREAPGEGVAPHLREALTVGRQGQRHLQPIDGLAVVLGLLALAAAGPTWSRQPDPFVAQSAPLVIALRVSPSMERDDIAPSRLERGKQKLRDLLELRAGARTALVAYAGSAHAVVPMSEDPNVMLPYLEGLVPEIMPEDGNRAADALALAQTVLGREEGPGAVLFVTDALDPADVAALETATTSVAVLVMLPEGQGDQGLDRLDATSRIALTADAADIRRIDALLNAEYSRALLENSDQPWEDRGPWLVWPAVLLALFWFRRGWSLRRAAILLVAAGLAEPGAARADGIADWFFTPDQQGRLAFQDRDFGRAAERFTDPLWRGYALYRDGQYEAAIEVLDRVETAQAAFIQGMAALKSRSYRDGVRAFETALARDPDYPGAKANLEVAREIVDYIERLREQSDTGEETGIGADDVVFDNEANRGVNTQIEVEREEGTGLLSTEQWMNTVDTRTGDFLRQRFALEAARRDREGEPDRDDDAAQGVPENAPEVAQ